MKSLLLRATLFLASFQLFAAESPATQTNFIAIKAGHLIDTVKGVVLERQVILIENDSIKVGESRRPWRCSEGSENYRPLGLYGVGRG